MTSFNLNCLLKALSANTVRLEVRASTYEFGRKHNSVHCRCKKRKKIDTVSVDQEKKVKKK
jgi:hypothetical protein